MEFVDLYRESPHYSDHMTRNVSFWIDKLPLETCERIAAWVRCEGNNDLLAFAQSSAQIRHSVVKVLRFKYDLNCYSTVREALEWAQLLSPFVKVVILDRSGVGNENTEAFQKCVEHRSIFELFLSPYLRRWYVSLHTERLLNKLAKRSWSHADTSLEFEKGQYSSRYLVQIVKDLSPTHLILNAVDEDTMCFSKLLFGADGGIIPDPKKLSGYPQMCQREITIDHNCLHIFADETGVLQTGWNITFADISEDLSEKPQLLEDVLEACRVIGDALNKLSALFPSSALPGLADVCPNLEFLYLKCELGKETDLANALPMLPKLRGIKLRFNRPWNSMESSFRYKVNPNAMLQLVRSCKELRELRLFGAYIENEKLACIFQEFGRRLQRFDSDCRARFMDWAECCDYLYATSVAAFAHCPQLCFAKVKAPKLCAKLDAHSDSAKRRRLDGTELLGAVLARRMKLITPLPPLLISGGLSFYSDFFSLSLRAAAP